jgi:tetratricopeptide (TPR) repeat protein
VVRHEKWIAFATCLALVLPAAAFAQQELPLRVGSYVVVTDDAKIYSGADPVEEVSRGMALKVRGSREGGWLWVTHHQNGWIQSKHVVPLQSALDYLAAEIAQQPQYAPLYNDRATVLFEIGDYAGAVGNYSSALKLSPDSLALRANRAVANFELGEYALAIKDLDEIVKKMPDDAQVHVDRGWAKYHAGQYEAALADYQRALELDPNSRQAQANLAWLRATCPDKKFRNGAEAMELAKSICEATQNKDSFALGTLAAAQAELGGYDLAAETQSKALDLASYTRKKMYRERLAFYSAGQPYRLGAEVPDVPAAKENKSSATTETKTEPEPADEVETEKESQPAAGNRPKSVLGPPVKPNKAVKGAEPALISPSEDSSALRE